jgi:hypothetical protein
MSDQSITAFLNETFTPEITEQICRELNLKELNDILDVRDSQIESLHVLAPLKRIFKRIRDQLKQRASVSNWLAKLKEHT